MYLETVEYWDDLYPESYKAVLPAYHLTLRSAKKVDSATTQLEVQAIVPEHLKHFLEDLEEGELEPLDEISRMSETDDDYLKNLEKHISSLT